MALTLVSDPILLEDEVTELIGADDDQAVLLINSCTAKFLAYTNRCAIISATQTEYIRGVGLSKVWLHAPPVTAVASVELLTGGEVSATIAAADFEFYATGKLWLRSTTVPDTGENNLKVVYTGGWARASIPGDITETALEVMRVDLERIKGRAGVTSIGVVSHSTSYETDGLPKSVKDVWDTYAVLL